jgi:hypothetical protein
VQTQQLPVIVVAEHELFTVESPRADRIERAQVLRFDGARGLGAGHLCRGHLAELELPAADRVGGGEPVAAG